MDSFRSLGVKVRSGRLVFSVVDGHSGASHELTVFCRYTYTNFNTENASLIELMNTRTITMTILMCFDPSDSFTTWLGAGQPRQVPYPDVALQLHLIASRQNNPDSPKHLHT